MKTANNVSAIFRAISFLSLLSAISGLPLAAYTNLGNNVLRSDGSVADTQAAINAASNGWTVEIQGGNFSWGSGITNSSKAIKIKGLGSGRIVARSATSNAVGTGTKTWNLASESVASIEALKTALANGATVRCEETTVAANWMEGTVTSLNGMTLTMNITSTGGSGTPTLWVFSTPASTTITHNAGSAVLFDMKESTAGSLEIYGIRFVRGTGTGNIIAHASSTNGQPILIHDCFFKVTTTSGCFIRTSSNRGVIWNSTFQAAAGFVQSNVICIQHKDAANSDAFSSGSWDRVHTMGLADTTGKNNLYIEDCDFHGFDESLDLDDNSRAVVRHNLFDNAALGTHGADTSNIGVRHYELYNNEFAFNDRGSLSFNLSNWIYIRGGTGVVTDNIMPNINSSWWGNKPEIRIQVQNLQRASGPHPLWGAGIAGVQYPCPRQFGFGRITGSGGRDSYTYNGDAEPFYQWNNTGSGSYANPALENYSSPTAGQDSIIDYVQVGREYINGQKPNYSKYAYPHSLRPAPPYGAKIAITAL